MTSVIRRSFSDAFGGLPDDADMATIARTAARQGFAVLPIAPLSKVPVCPLTELQARRADKEAAYAAQAAGRSGWERVRHPCGIVHATTDPKIAHRWFKRLEATHPGINLAVSVGDSQVLVADADTSQEMASWLTLWARKEGNEKLLQAAPTVRSPGERDEDGHWKHSEGGHFWFLLPDGVEFGDLAGTTSIPTGTDREHPAQLKVSGYVLVPPSVREEGPYVMAGDAQIAPPWLIEYVQDYTAGRRETQARRQDAALDADDMIRLAQGAISWAAILEPRGWMDSGKASRCGCPEWTAPGDHGSPKSATAHDPGCGEFDTSDGFIHVWTDNPPGDLGLAGTKTFSKIQFIAWHDHGGEMGPAMADLDIERRVEGGGTAFDYDADDEEIDRLAAPEHRDADADDGDEQDDEADDADGEQGVDPAPTDPVDALIAELIPADLLHTLPPPVPLVDGLLDANSLARVVGKSGHGKSFFMIDVAAHVALGMPWQNHEVTQGDVIYMVAEGSAGIQKRVRAWETHHGRELGARMKFLPHAIQVADHDKWKVWCAAMKRLRPALIVIDTQARVTAGMNENGPEDMGILVYRVEQLQKKTGACVVLVHHKGHQGDHGRGHSSVIAAADAEIEVTKEGHGKIAILSTKQKEQEDFAPIRLEMVKVRYGTGPKDESVVLLAPGEAEVAVTEQPPFDDEIVAVSETSSARDQIAALLYRTFEGGSGATKAEIQRLSLKYVKNRLGHPIVERTFHRCWAQLERASVLVAVGSKFQLAISEADRLGLRDDD